MSYLIKELPVEERPRERLKKYGVRSLSTGELLSILLRTGTKDKSVMDVSTNLLKEIPIHEFMHADYKQIVKVKGIGEVKALTILAAIEFTRRIMDVADYIYQIRDSNDAYYLVKDDLEREIQELFLAIYLDNKSYVIAKKILFKGTVNRSEVTARDVFREGVKYNATAIILVHNHPGGSVEASRADLELTKTFVFLGNMMGIKVIDHLIIGKNNYSSIRERYGEYFA